MKRHEADKLLEIASEELGIGQISKGHRAYVIGIYDERHGLEDGQLQLGVEEAGGRDEEPSQLHATPAPEEAAPRRESQRHRIIELLATFQVGKAWLAEEIAEQTGIPLNSVSTRMSELVAGGWVGDAGPKRHTSHGEPATTYVPTKKTLDYFREEVEQALAAA